ncbi:hypothetical protein BCR34DRAFT_465937, partial [Clohesyomyces aquaticus]
TSTLVLTTPQCTYLDIRLLKPLFPSPPPASTPTPSSILPITGGPSFALEWAFCGQSSTSPASPQVLSASTLPVKHATWHHWLDSRFSVGSPEIPRDEGDMYTVSANQTCEFGSAWNAAGNAVVSYEEMWEDMRIKSTDTDADKVKKRIQAMVLRLDESAHGVRGMVVRVGQFVQGMLKRGNEVTVERWEFLEKRDAQGKVVGGDWTRLVRLGDLFLPCAVAFEPEKVEVGNTVTYELFAWVVEE